MQQFWHIVTKIKESTFYEFRLANKKCQFDVEVFLKALDTCPRVQGKEFIEPPSEEELLTFLIGLGYKGELTHLPKMLIDHMHQPWRTLESIINKCLSRNTTRNDRLHQSRVAIIWGMFYKKNVDIAELIWEDFPYQIDNRLLKKGRRENMPYPRFTKPFPKDFSYHRILITMSQKEKPELPRSSSSRSLSLNYGNQFLNLSFASSFVGTIKETTKAEINSLLDVQIQQEILFDLLAPLLDVLVSVIPPQTTTTSTPLTTPLNTPLPTPPIISTATTTTPTVSDSLPVVVPSVVDEYLGSTLGDTLQKVKREQAAKEKIPKYSSTPYDQQADKEHKQKDILFKMMIASKSYERHPAHKALYDALLESIFVDENDIDRLANDPAYQRKRRHDDKDEDPSTGSYQGKKKRKNGKKSKSSRKSSTSKESSKGKTLPKSSNTAKYVHAEETVKEPTHEVAMDVEEPPQKNVEKNIDHH
ncbi:hypothetical protein Tco_0097333 [Tanacetum coccineum]